MSWLLDRTPMWFIKALLYAAVVFRQRVIAFSLLTGAYLAFGVIWLIARFAPSDVAAVMLLAVMSSWLWVWPIGLALLFAAICVLSWWEHGDEDDQASSLS